MAYILLILGFILLIKGADFFVEGASSVAKLLKIPSIIIGLTIVAFGTSAPELAVSVNAAIKGNNGIALGNVVGSNIFNLLVVIGICAIIHTVNVDKKILNRDHIFNLILTAVLGVLLFIGSDVSGMDGIILLVFFAIFLFYTIRLAFSDRQETKEDEKILSPILSGIYIIGGLLAIVYGGDFVVDSASAIALQFGMSESLIGLTIVAVGTSLPELVTSIVAARKGEPDIALGNVIGSNIFNIAFILGVSATIHPFSVQMSSVYDIVYLIAVSVLFYVFAYRGKIDRVKGVILTALYIAYTIYLIILG